MSTFKYRAAALSDAGIEKTVNQDSYYLKMGSYNQEYFVFALVADGMGGVGEGELASRSLSAGFANWFHEDLKTIFENAHEEDGDSIEEQLISDWDRIITNVNLELNTYGSSQGYEKGSGPGSTVSALFLYCGTYYIVNIGDSRIYKKNARLKLLTKDHSWAQEAKEAGLSEEEIENDRRVNMITRCVGCNMTDHPEGDYFAGVYADGDSFLLCSDGLRRVLDDGVLKDVLEDDDLNTREKCVKAVTLAKEGEETDNITSIIIEAIRDDEAGERKDDHLSMSESTYIETNGNITEALKVR